MFEILSTLDKNKKNAIYIKFDLYDSLFGKKK